MVLKIYAMHPTKEVDHGLHMTVYSNRDAGNNIELGSIVNSIERFYKDHLMDRRTGIPKIPKEGDANALLYWVLSSGGFVGTVRITPDGRSIKNPQPDLDIDYPDSDRTKYFEKYWVNFFPEDEALRKEPSGVHIESLRKEHRDGYIEFVQPFVVIRS